MAISISATRNRANELYAASRELNLACSDIDNAINSLRAGATTNKIKTEISNLNNIRSSLSSKARELSNKADQIMPIAYRIRREEQAK